jgi:gamma-glutamyltranspeptidase/glutathione hydrolase
MHEHSAAEPEAVGPAVAAADIATAAVGARVLDTGGNAADAAVAAALAACAAETIYTGLAGGGFAVHLDAVTGIATVVDFFVCVPGAGLDREVAPMQAIHVSFGAAPLEYHVGAATVAVPGTPRGLHEVHRRFGRMAWHDVVQPGYELAAGGVSLSAQKALGLAVMREAMCLGEGAAAYAPKGRLLGAGERLWHRGLDRSFAVLRDEGPDPFYTGAVAETLLDTVAAAGGAVTETDLAAYRALVSPARAVPFGSATVHGRTDLLDLLGTIGDLPAGIGTASPAERARSWVHTLMDPRRGRAESVTGTSNVCAVDADGNACVITTSLGLGSGDWVPGYGLHLNSMIGEGELMVAGADVGSRVPSMMSPVVATDGSGLLAAAGAAGGSRIRSSMVQVLCGVLAEGLDPAAAVQRPRLHPVRSNDTVIAHVEPGTPPDVVAALKADGLAVHEWDATSAYFGGVSVIARTGAAADPRRDGAVARPTSAR